MLRVVKPYFCTNLSELPAVAISGAPTVSSSTTMTLAPASVRQQLGLVVYKVNVAG